MRTFVAVGLTNSGRMTPECIIGLVMNLGVGMGDELASEVVFEATNTCGCCVAVMGTKTLLEAVVLLNETKRFAASILASCSRLGNNGLTEPPFKLRCLEQ